MDDVITLLLADDDGPGAFFSGPFTDAQYWLSANLSHIRIECDTTKTNSHRVLAHVPAFPFRQLFPEVPTVSPIHPDASAYVQIRPRLP